MSGGKNKKSHGGGGGGGHGGGWVITFADLMSLLMALFVMIVSFSNQDEQKLEEAVGSIKEAFGVSALSELAGIIERDGVLVRDHPLDASLKSTDQGAQYASRDSDHGDAQGPSVESSTIAHASSDTIDSASYAAAAQSLRQALNDMPDYADVSKQVMMRETEDGLEISLVDQDGSAMFAQGSTVPNERLRAVIRRITPVIAEADAPLRIVGHTEAGSYVSTGASPAWGLSAERAVATAKLFAQSGLPPDVLAVVSGAAETEPLFPDNPFLAGNRRIAITLLRHEPALPARAVP
ncbi:OmpA/MotB family protein [Methylobrevis albus]|uniref:Flagellar motor protein MotB n=1 Tax=Methylobrevis albus TaxID=2793297 RepID=A0A931I600_9HYPH|nr:flagellar motor protein MotB [Methylobrevis albus]MBH0239911.1 flagellar motor protein MotB [Methylobrevis albus]